MFKFNFLPAPDFCPSSAQIEIIHFACEIGSMLTTLDFLRSSSLKNEEFEFENNRGRIFIYRKPDWNLVGMLVRDD